MNKCYIYYHVYVLQPRTKFLKSDTDKIPLPDPFPLPLHFPHCLESALASGKLTIKERQMFVTEVASCMLCFKRYPDKEDYICVARTVVSKYLFMKPANGNAYVILTTLFINF